MVTSATYLYSERYIQMNITLIHGFIHIDVNISSSAANSFVNPIKKPLHTNMILMSMKTIIMCMEIVKILLV